MRTATKIGIIIFILMIAFALRFYKLGTIPPGLHGDAASQGYNAFSLLKTGKDRYGESFPILFRSLGSYQPPLYTYLTTIPVAIFGNTAISTYFISALSGVILVFVTYLLSLVLFENTKYKQILALISALIVSVSPWSVLFSRLAVEANLGLLIFVLSILIFIYSLKKIQLLPLASLLLGISTHAYYSERLIALIFLPAFILFFKKIFFSQKKWLIFAIILFLITQIPHFWILNSGALTRRFDQVSYLGNQSGIPYKIYYLGKTAINNYLIYYSPKNLFFDSDINLGRTMPGLSIFYSWFVVPFIIGIWYLLKKAPQQVSKIIGLLIIITPIPAAFTGDFFYPLRTLDFLWVLALVISMGLCQIFQFLKSKKLKLFLSINLFVYSLFSLYISYFILFKYEKAENYGYAYIKLMDKLPEYKNKQVIIDLARDPGVGIRIAYLEKYPPNKLQNQLRAQLKTPYYSSMVNTDEIYELGNIEIKPLDFKTDTCRSNTLIVGDQLAISPKQMEEHNLKKEFEIKDLSGHTSLVGYLTNSANTCISN